ncbi:DUF3566 domain-containing protein [Isoptericola sp. F-RaC21]|uniref:DUF3566 domain-containing protein n=1 Tax=Isoptericola sp. F-RaC21 TaxID=3141452 RepID=UPI00315B4FFE
MTENSASTRASSAPPAREADVDDSTHRRGPAASTPSGTTSSKTSAGAVRVGEVPAPPAPPAAAPQASSAAAAPADGATAQGASPVKEGAVKAAAAALAAARSAAKKVQSVMPEAPAKGQDGAADSPQSAAKPAEPRPEMHYSAGGVQGTAAPAAGSPMVGTAQPGMGPRRVRLSVSRVDPWSIMKLAFLLSVAIGFITVVATMVVWYVLNDMGTFATVQTFLSDTIGPQAVNLMQFVQFDRVVSLSVLIAIVNVVLLTALATIMAILYNITAALVGGVHLTLTDE